MEKTLHPMSLTQALEALATNPPNSNKELEEFLEQAPILHPQIVDHTINIIKSERFRTKSALLLDTLKISSTPTQKNTLLKLVADRDMSLPSNVLLSMLNDPTLDVQLTTLELLPSLAPRNQAKALLREKYHNPLAGLEVDMPDEEINIKKSCILGLVEFQTKEALGEAFELLKENPSLDTTVLDRLSQIGSTTIWQVTLRHLDEDWDELPTERKLPRIDLLIRCLVPSTIPTNQRQILCRLTWEGQFENEIFIRIVSLLTQINDDAIRSYFAEEILGNVEPSHDVSRIIDWILSTRKGKREHQAASIIIYSSGDIWETCWESLSNTMAGNTDFLKGIISSLSKSGARIDDIIFGRLESCLEEIEKPIGDDINLSLLHLSQKASGENRISIIETILQHLSESGSIVTARKLLQHYQKGNQRVRKAVETTLANQLNGGKYRSISALIELWDKESQLKIEELLIRTWQRIISVQGKARFLGLVSNVKGSNQWDRISNELCNSSPRANLIDSIKDQLSEYYNKRLLNLLVRSNPEIARELLSERIGQDAWVSRASDIIDGLDILIQIGPPYSIQPLKEMLEGESRQSVRRKIIETLGKSSSRNASSVLRIALHDRDPKLVLKAIEGLKEIVDYDSIQALKEREVHEPKPAIKQAATKCLEEYSVQLAKEIRAAQPSDSERLLQLANTAKLLGASEPIQELSIVLKDTLHKDIALSICEILSTNTKVPDIENAVQYRLDIEREAPIRSALELTLQRIQGHRELEIATLLNELSENEFEFTQILSGSSGRKILKNIFPSSKALDTFVDTLGFAQEKENDPDAFVGGLDSSATYFVGCFISWKIPEKKNVPDNGKRGLLSQIDQSMATYNRTLHNLRLESKLYHATDETGEKPRRKLTPADAKTARVAFWNLICNGLECVKDNSSNQSLSP